MQPHQRPPERREPSRRVHVAGMTAGPLTAADAVAMGYLLADALLGERPASD